jgi:radical SAM superfamily enzyme YgiQ (UPF0313 family)
MHYEGRIFRPPNESDAILLQVTVGCSHNTCTFCGMYREKQFAIKPMAQIHRDLVTARARFPRIGRVFLCDGDALCLPQSVLLEILEGIRRELPQVILVSTYANAKSVAAKSNKELCELRALNLKLFHLGLESGDDVTLSRVHKYGNAQFHADVAARATQADIKLFVTVLLGLGGRERSQQHAMATAQALSAMQPSRVGALSLMLIPGTPLYASAAAGHFELPSPREMLLELRTMIAQVNMRGTFYANHASNYLPLRARLPKEKDAALEQIDAALEGRTDLIPEWMRSY